jgi:hypothetical protein
MDIPTIAGPTLTPTPTPRVRRRNIPSLDDAGYLLYSITSIDTETTREVYNLFSKDLKRYYVKLSLEIWREVEKCI